MGSGAAPEEFVADANRKVCRTANLSTTRVHVHANLAIAMLFEGLRQRQETWYGRLLDVRMTPLKAPRYAVRLLSNQGVSEANGG